MRAALSLLFCIACADGTTADGSEGSDTALPPADSGTPPTGPVPCTADTLPIPGEALYLEGDAVDASGRVFAGSLGTGQIFAAPDCTASEFATLDAGRQAVGLFYDDARDVLLACDSTLDGVAPTLAVFDGLTGARLASHPLDTGYGFGLCNDATVGADGTVYVTESYVSMVFVVPPADLLTDGVPATLWLQDPLFAVTPGSFGLNGLAAVGSDLFLAHSASGALFRVPVQADGAPGAPSALTLSAPISPDGMRALPDGSLLLVDAGVAGVVHVEVAGDAATVTPIATGLNLPTSAMPTPDGTAAWVVESQFDLFGYDPAPPDPFQLVRVELP
jgi:hypothetical protein